MKVSLSASGIVDTISLNILMKCFRIPFSSFLGSTVLVGLTALCVLFALLGLTAFDVLFCFLGSTALVGLTALCVLFALLGLTAFVVLTALCVFFALLVLMALLALFALMDLCISGSGTFSSLHLDTQLLLDLL